jgi:hypothetical protein
MSALRWRRKCVLPWSGLLVAILCLPAWAIDPTQLAGDWLAPAEDADDVDAIVNLSWLAPAWHGTIKAIRVTQPDQKYRDDSLCSKCKGTQHNRPLKGLEIVWGLHDGKDRLTAGKILDPSDGEIYDCEMQLSADGKTLHVLAYKGIKLLGHTMTWARP